MGSQVLSPTHDCKSQHGGKLPTFECQETIKIWLIIVKVDLDYFKLKHSRDLCGELGGVSVLKI